MHYIYMGSEKGIMNSLSWFQINISDITGNLLFYSETDLDIASSNIHMNQSVDQSACKQVFTVH